MHPQARIMGRTGLEMEVRLGVRQFTLPRQGLNRSSLTPWSETLVEVRAEERERIPTDSTPQA